MIEIFYTGGGITIAEADIDKTRYAVVSSDAPEYLTVYANTDEKTHLPEDMLFSCPQGELPPELKPLYAEMVSRLAKV